MRPQTFAVRCGVLHDGTGGPPDRNVTVIVDDGRIEDIGTMPAPDGAPILEAACVVPGLVNAHAHLEMSGEPQTMSVFVLTTEAQRLLAAAANARKSLHAGVTTIRDLGGNAAVDVRDAIEAGKIPGPTVVAAASALCMTGGHGWFVGRETDGPWDARKAVREQLKRGANCIKLIATGGVLTKGAVPGIEQLTEEEMRAAIAEAHTHGMRVAAHAIGTEGIKNALRAGVDSIEHGHLLDEDALRLFKKQRTFLVPTLAALMCIVENAAHGGQPDYVVRKATELRDKMIDNITRAYKAGVRIAGGSDAGTPYNFHENYAYEVELMHTLLGMSPLEALKAATVCAAELLAVDAGTIERGHPADFLCLDRDVADDIRALRDPRKVVKGGAIVFER